MAVPQVSPENWERVKTFAQIELGGREPPAERLSFNDQLLIIIENTGGVKEPFSTFETVLQMDNPVHPVWADEVRVSEGKSSTGNRQYFEKKQKAREKSEKELIREAIEYRVPEDQIKMYVKAAKRASAKRKEEEERERPTELDRLNLAFAGKVVDCPTFQVKAPERSRAHRPEVDNEVVEMMEKVLDELRPRFPARMFDFDDALGVYMDELESVYGKLALEIEYGYNN